MRRPPVIAVFAAPVLLSACAAIIGLGDEPTGSVVDANDSGNDTFAPPATDASPSTDGSIDIDGAVAKQFFDPTWADAGVLEVPDATSFVAPGGADGRVLWAGDTNPGHAEFHRLDAKGGPDLFDAGTGTQRIDFYGAPSESADLLTLVYGKLIVGGQSNYNGQRRAHLVTLQIQNPQDPSPEGLGLTTNPAPTGQTYRFVGAAGDPGAGPLLGPFAVSTGAGLPALYVMGSEDDQFRPLAFGSGTPLGFFPSSGGTTGVAARFEPGKITLQGITEPRNLGTAKPVQEDPSLPLVTVSLDGATSGAVTQRLTDSGYTFHAFLLTANGLRVQNLTGNLSISGMIKAVAPVAAVAISASTRRPSDNAAVLGGCAQAAGSTVMVPWLAVFTYDAATDTFAPTSTFGVGGQLTLPDLRGHCIGQVGFDSSTRLLALTTSSDPASPPRLIRFPQQ